MLTRSALLSENGLPDLPALLVEPHRNPGGIWRIKFSYEASEPLSMSAVQASTMASALHAIGEAEPVQRHSGWRGEGVVTSGGAFSAVTSPHTGRSPNDKFLVQEPDSSGKIWWGKVNQPMDQAHWDVLHRDFIASLTGKELYDLKTDPGQKTDVADKHPEVVPGHHVLAQLAMHLRHAAGHERGDRDVLVGVRLHDAGNMQAGRGRTFHRGDGLDPRARNHLWCECDDGIRGRGTGVRRSRADPGLFEQFL
jgi:hypothetical protein